MNENTPVELEATQLLELLKDALEWYDTEQYDPLYSDPQWVVRAKILTEGQTIRKVKG